MSEQTSQPASPEGEVLEADTPPPRLRRPAAREVNFAEVAGRQRAAAFSVREKLSILSQKAFWNEESIRTYRQSVRQFIHNEFVPQQAQWRQQRRPDAGAWPAAGSAGLLLPDVPREYGGGGGGFPHLMVVLEELVKAGVQLGVVNQSVTAHYIYACGDEEQKRRWLPRLARGELIGAIALTEPNAGSDLQHIETTAVRDGGDYLITGAKACVTNGWHANLVCLAAKTDDRVSGMKGLSLFVVETKDLPGYRLVRSLDKIGMEAQDICELAFDNVRVPADSLLGMREGRGFSQMMEHLPFERLLIASLAVARMEYAVAITAQYVKERMAFGKSLIEFQNTRFKLAECKTAAHIGRVFLDHCIERFMAGQLDEVTAAMAKYWLTDRECRVMDECVQMHGANGFMTDYPIARMWADSRAQRIYAGTNEIMKELIAWSM